MPAFEPERMRPPYEPETPAAGPGVEPGAAEVETAAPADTDAAAAPEPTETPEQLLETLRTRGEPIESRRDAEQRWGDGDRIFAFHEMDEAPSEVTRRETLDNYAPDRLLALPREPDVETAETAAGERPVSRVAELEAEAELDAQMAAESRDRGRREAVERGLSEAVQRTLGETENAPQIEWLADPQGLPADTRRRAGKRRSTGTTVKGAYDPRDNRVYLFTDALTDSADAAWTAAHEIAGHAGLRGFVGRDPQATDARQRLDTALERAGQNTTVRQVAERITAQRDRVQGTRATEEALAELAAATRTGDFDAIERRYGVQVPEAQRPTVRGAIERFIERLKQLLRRRTGETYSDAQVRELLEGAWRYVRDPDPRVDEAVDRAFTDTAGIAPETAEVEQQEAFHGTTEQFERFSTDYVGTGEGADAYGWGLYFTSKREIADWYRRHLAGEPGGRVVRADVPENSELMDWNAPLAEQSETVQAGVRAALESFGLPFRESGTGLQQYHRLRRQTGSNEATSRLLAEHGLKGHRFVGATSGETNFVVYDENAVQVLDDNDIDPIELMEGPPEGDRRAGERRAGVAPGGRRGAGEAARKRVADMTTDELRQALLEHELTGIPNRRAYDEAEKLATQVAVDVDSLKWVNDNMGHESGNELLRAVAEALADETDQAFHLSGDEFVVQAADAAQAEQLMGRALERLAGAEIEVRLPDGQTVTIEGLEVSYGTGETLDAADEALQQSKQQRATTGERAERGEAPRGVRRGRDRAGEAPAETGRTGDDTRRGQPPEPVVERRYRTDRPQPRLRSNEPDTAAPGELATETEKAELDDIVRATPADANSGDVLASGLSGPAGENYQPLYQQTGAPTRPRAPTLTREGTPRKIDLPREPIRREHVMELFQRLFGVHVYQGSPFKVRKALGFFRPRNFEVRIRDKNDLEVTAHEVFHWLDRTYKPLRALYHEQQYRAELRGVSYDVEKIYEGFAEFGRLFMTQEPEAIARAPRFYEAFIAKADELGLLRDLERVQVLMHQWYLQGAQQRAESKIGNVPAPLMQRIDANVDYASDKFIHMYLDRRQAAKVVEREILGGLAPDAAHSPYKSFQLLLGASSTIDSVVNYGTPAWDANGDLVYSGTGLKQALQPIASVLDDALAYFLGRRAAELRRYGKEKLFTDDEIQAMLDRGHNSPKAQQIIAAFDAYQDYQSRVLDFAEQSGILNPRTRALWEELYKNYVPMYRVISDVRGTGVRTPSAASPFKRLMGGTSNVNDILDNMIQNTALIVEAAMRNMAKRQLFATIESSPLGQRFAVRIPTDTAALQVGMDQVKRVITELRDQAEQQWRQIVDERGRDDAAAMEYGQIQQLADALVNRSADQGQVEIDELMAQATFFKTGQPPTNPDHDFVLINGKPRYFQIADPLLWEMLQDVNYHQPMGMMLRVFGGFSRVLRRGVTVVPEFQFRNITRDIQQAFVVGRQWPLVDALRALPDIWFETDTFKEYMLNGGGFGIIQGEQARKVRLRLGARAAFAGESGLVRAIVDSPSVLADTWDKYGYSFELATRLAEAKRARGTGRTRREATWRGLNVSTDFRMRGISSLSRIVQTAFTFTNARLQGLYLIERQLFERRGRQSWRGDNTMRFATRGFLGLTLPGIAAYLWMRDDEDYEDLGEEVKSLYVVLPSPDGDGVVMYPKGFEVGLLFQEIPVRLLERAIDDLGSDEAEKKRLRDAMLFSLMETLSVNPAPQAVSPAVNVFWRNRQWNGLPIVPRSLENVEPREQFRPWTSETFKELGDRFNLSPLKVQALFEGYFGTVSSYLLAGSDALIFGNGDVEDPAVPLRDWPVIRAFNRREPYRSTRHEQAFYDMASEIDRVVNNARLLRNRLDQEGFNAYLGEAEQQQLLALSDTSDDVRTTAQQIRDQMQRVRDSGVMSAEAKRERMDELQRQMNDLFREAVEQMEPVALEGFRDALEGSAGGEPAE